MRILSLLLLAVFTLTACSAASVETESPHEVPFKTPDPAEVNTPLPENGPDESVYSSRPGDDQLSRAAAYLNVSELTILESYPVQVNLYLNGRLPTPCHELRVAVDPPDKENRIYIDVYTLVDPAIMCIQVIKDFDTTVSLGTFPAGHYSVYVNDELIGEFDS